MWARDMKKICRKESRGTSRSSQANVEVQVHAKVNKTKFMKQLNVVYR